MVMKLKDTAEIIRCDIPDLTEGPFDVVVESDDGGNHIVVKIEDHDDGHKILEFLTKEFPKVRTLVLLVPFGYLECFGSFNSSKEY
jgi:hypothetical protein